MRRADRHYLTCDLSESVARSARWWLLHREFNVHVVLCVFDGLLTGSNYFITMN